VLKIDSSEKKCGSQLVAAAWQPYNTPVYPGAPRHTGTTVCAFDAVPPGEGQTNPVGRSDSTTRHAAQVTLSRSLGLWRASRKIEETYSPRGVARLSCIRFGFPGRRHGRRCVLLRALRYGQCGAVRLRPNRLSPPDALGGLDWAFPSATVSARIPPPASH
jgi:hypothetical protein